jgi:hypothetical protein
MLNNFNEFLWGSNPKFGYSQKKTKIGEFFLYLCCFNFRKINGRTKNF